MKLQIPRHKADPLFFEYVGKYILEWMKDNRTKRLQPKNQMELKQILERKCSYKISLAMLSRYIHGESIFPYELQHILIDQLGFRYDIFADYVLKKRDGLRLKQLTIEDLWKFVYEQNELMVQYKNDAMIYREKYLSIHLEIANLARSAMKTVTELDAVYKENRELRKKLKKLDPVQNAE